MRSLITSAFLFAITGASAQVLTAEEAVRIAVEQNYGIRFVRLDARAAEVMNTAGQAGMLPDIDAIGSYGVDNRSTKQTFFSGEIREVDNADANVFNAAVQMNWTVFDGLTMFATKDRLATVELIGQTRLRGQIEATTYEVLSTYYRLVQLRKAIEVQREGVRISRERLTIAEAGQRIGTASGLVVVQAHLDLSADSAVVLDLQVQEAISAARLNALMGRDPSTMVVVVSEIAPIEPLELAPVQTAARQSNSMVQQARQQQIAADLNVKEFRGVLLPRLDLYANYGYTRAASAVGFLQSNRGFGPDYGARVSIPLFHGSQDRQALEVAKLGREQAVVSTQQAELDLEESLLNAWTNYTFANQRIALEEHNLIGARTQAEVALESYRLGAITAIELRDVQLGLIAASERLIVAQYEAKVAELQLKWLAGRLT